MGRNGAQLDYVIVNELEACTLAEHVGLSVEGQSETELGRQIAMLYGTTVVVTLGANGAAVFVPADTEEAGGGFPLRATLKATALKVSMQQLPPLDSEKVLLMQMEIPHDQNWAAVKAAYSAGAGMSHGKPFCFVAGATTVINVAPAGPVPADTLRM
eukprot:gene24560-29875_t